MNQIASNDYELLYYSRQKDDFAINELWIKYQPFARKIVNDCVSKNIYCEIYRDDLIQEAWISLADATYFYRDTLNCAFSSFFYTCAYRKIKSILRHYLREANHGNIYGLSLDSVVNEEGGNYLIDQIESNQYLMNPHYYFRYIENIKQVKKAIEELTEVDKKTLSLYINNSSYSDAAKVLNCSSKTYDNRVQKVKRTLKAKIYE